MKIHVDVAHGFSGQRQVQRPDDISINVKPLFDRGHIEVVRYRPDRPLGMLLAFVVILFVGEATMANSTDISNGLVSNGDGVNQPQSRSSR